jgi:hypothetical protein
MACALHTKLLLARTANSEMNRYMDMQIDKTLSLPQQEL